MMRCFRSRAATRLALFLMVTPAIAPPLAAQTIQQQQAQQQQTAGSSSVGVDTGPASVLIDDQRATAQSKTTLLQDQRAGRRPPPFGAELFQGATDTVASTVADPNYTVRPGDRISISTFGLVNGAADAEVDAKGNVLVPNVGPVPVAGVPAGSINKTISAAAGQVYQSTTQVYATLQGSGRIKVFVTGPVLRPGAYSGDSVDSVVTYLQRAGGIDFNRGSFRNISIRRNGREVANVDLYAFLLTGDLPNLQLRGNETIVVGQQGGVVAVSGDARSPYTFEFPTSSGTGDELLRVARPRPEVTHVSILGTRDGKPFNAYVTRQQFASLPLMDGDRVRFSADAPSETFVVRVEGAHTGPSAYTVSRGQALGPLLRQIPLDPLADTPMIHLERQSVAAAQKQLLDESLSRLEKVIYTTPAPTSGVAQARQVDTQGLATYIERARSVEPRGLVSLPEGADLDRVLLEPDDVIVVPFQSQTVVIAGEVSLPQTLLWTPGGTAKTYVEQAGGYGSRANRKETLVIHPDGSTDRGGAVRAGDRILVPPRISGQTIELFKDLTQILYQTAIGALAIFGGRRN
jgi:protein involved in polysaccharide export with SLBB domain